MITRVLEFDGPVGVRRLTLLHEGFLLGQRTLQVRENGFEDVRREAAILKKLCAISREDGDHKLATGDALRVLSVFPATVVLTAPEHALLKRYYEATPWMAGHADDVVDAADFLLSATEVSD